MNDSKLRTNDGRELLVYAFGEYGGYLWLMFEGMTIPEAVDIFNDKAATEAMLYNGTQELKGYTRLALVREESRNPDVVQVCLRKE